MIDTALQFSGGKDSLACLYLNRHRWGDIYVVWLDTGAAYPETFDYMMRWKERLPHFVHLKSNQPEDIVKNGWPVDVLPIENTHLGKAITGNKGPLMQSHLECCARNIWFPLFQGTVDLGVKTIIKGQRSADRRKSVATDGLEFAGVKFEMPIQDWTDKQVLSYLKEVGAELAPGYKDGEKTGRDCWDCTAYLDDNMRRISNLPRQRQEIVWERLSEIDHAIKQQWVR